jgi:hypothetical protein
MTVDAASRASETSLRVTVARGIAYYYLTSLVVFLAVVAGATLLVRSHYALPHAGGFAGHFAYGNGGDYVAVAQDGYDFDPRAQSYVAFFPVFPLLGRGVMRLTGVEPQVALVLVSNAALAGAFVALLAYARLRMADAPPDAAEFALLALGLYPAGVFFRMAYTESTFLLVAVLAMYALARPWPLWIAALLVGLATATRATGVALLPPLALAAWQAGGTPAWRLARMAWAIPLGCWGLAAFMAYQLWAFGDPLAFVTAHGHWWQRPPVPWSQKLPALVTFEPFWRVYDASSDVYWAEMTRRVPACFSLPFANPLYVVGAVLLTALGGWRRWLDAKEVLLVAGLLLLPYFTRNYEMGMLAAARFTSVAFPIYLVLGRILARLPAPLAAAMLVLCGLMLAIYAAQFAAGYIIT